jgi:hypothetical protein
MHEEESVLSCPKETSWNFLGETTENHSYCMRAGANVDRKYV